MRINSCLFLIICFFIINLNVMVYASPVAKNDNTGSTNNDNQQIITQEKKYKLEVSTAVSLGIKLRQYPEYLAFFASAVPVRIGLINPKNIGIEAEVDFRYDTDIPKIRPFFLLHFNYNFESSSQIKPFLLGGAGFLSEKDRAEVEPYEEFRKSYFLWNAGAGLRWFIKKKFALRLDYSFIFYNRKRANVMFHNIFFGGSLFF